MDDFPQLIIDLCAEKQDADAEVDPQHQQNHRRQTAVHVGKAAEMVEIDGKAVGEQQPSGGGKHSPGKLVFDRVLPVGQEPYEATAESIDEEAALVVDCQGREIRLQTGEVSIRVFE